MVEFVQVCCCSPYAHLCLVISSAPWYWGDESSVMLLSHFCNEAITLGAHLKMYLRGIPSINS